MRHAPGCLSFGVGAVIGFERIPRTSGSAACAAKISSELSSSNQACATMALGNPYSAFILPIHSDSAT